MVKNLLKYLKNSLYLSLSRNRDTGKGKTWVKMVWCFFFFIAVRKQFLRRQTVKLFEWLFCLIKLIKIVLWVMKPALLTWLPVPVRAVLTRCHRRMPTDHITALFKVPLWLSLFTQTEERQRQFYHNFTFGLYILLKWIVALRLKYLHSITLNMSYLSFSL